MKGEKMKKIILIIIIIILILSLNKNSDIEIPENAIRFRVIANSNSQKEQMIKRQVIENIKPNLISIMKNSNNIDNSRNNIINNIDEIKDKTNKFLIENNINQEADVVYGDNYFPVKKYKGTKYNAGNYESLVIKLGKAKGNNFWCVLFPPLCMVEEDKSLKGKVEYKSYVKELLDKYFK